MIEMFFENKEVVQALIGPNIPVCPMTRALRLEVKADKFESRLIAFTPFRWYMFTAKNAFKLEHSFNYVDLSSIESTNPTQLTLGVQKDSRYFKFQVSDSIAPDQVDIFMTWIICQLIAPLKALFAHVPLEEFIKKLEVEPRTRWNDINERLMEMVTTATASPCGGFAQQYGCFCDYFGVAYQEEVAADVNAIYASSGTAELSFVDFEHLEPKDLVPLVAALTYNAYFTKFRMSNVKIGAGGGGNHSSSEQLLEQILNLVKRSTTLVEIYFDNIGVRADFVNKLTTALLFNSSRSSLQVIDLAGNALEDKGLRGLTSFIAKSFRIPDGAPNGLPIKAGGASNDLNLSHASLSHINQLNNSNYTAAPPAVNLMYNGLVHLNLARCNLTAKGVSELSEALYVNKSMFSTLTYLNLSDNNLSADISKLYNFLAQPNNLAHLDLSGTDCNLESVFGALLRGCTNNLVHLNLARNQYTPAEKPAKNKELAVPASVKRFFQTAIFLRTVNLSQNRLPPDVVKSILLGLAFNESAADIRLNLSANDLKANGGTVVELTLTGIRCVSGLDLSDNGLDMELIGVIGAISKNKAIKHLSIGKNFSNIKAKHLPKVLDAFAQMLLDPMCSLESLSLVESKLRNEMCVVLNALGTNQSLINIDLTGNSMGPAGAKALAKALMVNTKLETISLDRNQITTNGFIDIAYAMERNFTVKHMPTPMVDVHQAMLKTPERTEAAFTRIHDFLRRNNLPQTALMRSMRLQTGVGGGLLGAHAGGQAFSLDPRLYSMIEHTSNQLAQAMRSTGADERMLNGSNRIPSVDSIDLNFENDAECSKLMNNGGSESMLRAEYLLRDVANIRSLGSKIQELYTQTQANASSGTSGAAPPNDALGRRMSTFAVARPIEANIVEFARELRRTFEVQIGSICELMISHVKEQFPQVFCQAPYLEAELKESVKVAVAGPQSLVPPVDYFHSCLTESAGIAWSAKLEGILNSIAARLCNRVLIEITHCLVTAHKAITGGGGGGEIDGLESMGLLLNGRSLTPEVLRGRVWNESMSSHESADINLAAADASLLDVNGNNALATPKMQMLGKKQNVYIRKPRPQSVMDGALQQPHTAGADYAEHAFSSLAETPTTKTQHLTKARPRAPKSRRQATRVTIVESSKAVEVGGGGVRVDEGLDAFFPVIKMTGISSDSLDCKEPPVSCSPPSSSAAAAAASKLFNSKPQPQPRKFLGKFLGKSTDHQPEVLSQMASTPLAPTSHYTTLKNDDFAARSVSPTAYAFSASSAATAKRPSETSHVSICAAEPADLERSVHSPVPASIVGDAQQQHAHNGLLAEIRAKQERRTHHLSGDQLGDASKATPAESAAEASNKKGHNSIGPFGTNGAGNGISNGNGSSLTVTASNGAAYHPPVKQRPKSMVGILSGKFEMSAINSGK